MVEVTPLRIVAGPGSAKVEDDRVARPMFTEPPVSKSDSLMRKLTHLSAVTESSMEEAEAVERALFEEEKSRKDQPQKVTIDTPVLPIQPTLDVPDLHGKKYMSPEEVESLLESTGSGKQVLEIASDIRPPKVFPNITKTFTAIELPGDDNITAFSSTHPPIANFDQDATGPEYGMGVNFTPLHTAYHVNGMELFQAPAGDYDINEVVPLPPNVFVADVNLALDTNSSK